MREQRENSTLWVDLVRQSVKDDPDACELIHCYAQITHVWDDLIDKDKPVEDADVHRAFWHATVTIPNNPFFLRHRQTLLPIWANAIVTWRSANLLEQEKEEGEGKMLSYVLRHSPLDLFVACATIIGGVEWGAEWGAILRKGCLDGTFDEYLKELRGKDGMAT